MTAKKDKDSFGTTSASGEPAPPEYGEVDCWHACFALDKGRNTASWTPKVSNLQSHQKTAECDCFYVHPTTALRGLGNAEVLSCHNAAADSEHRMMSLA